MLRGQNFPLVGHPAGGAGMISRKGVVLGVVKSVKMFDPSLLSVSWEFLRGALGEFWISRDHFCDRFAIIAISGICVWG